MLRCCTNLTIRVSARTSPLPAPERRAEAHFPGQRRLGGPERARGQASAAGKPFLSSKSDLSPRLQKSQHGHDLSCFIFIFSTAANTWRGLGVTGGLGTSGAAPGGLPRAALLGEQFLALVSTVPPALFGSSQSPVRSAGWAPPCSRGSPGLRGDRHPEVTASHGGGGATPRSSLLLAASGREEHLGRRTSCLNDCLSQSHGSSLHPIPEPCLKFLPPRAAPEAQPSWGGVGGEPLLLADTVPSVPSLSGHSRVHSL